MFWFTLVLSLGAVGARGLSLCGGVQVGSLLRQSSMEKPAVKYQPSLLHGNACDLENFTVGVCMQYWRITRHLGPFLGGTDFLGRPCIGKSAGG